MKTPENHQGNNRLEQNRFPGSRVSRIAALGFAAAAGVAVTLYSPNAEAQAATVEFEEVNLTVDGTVEDGFLVFELDTGGWFSSTKGKIKIDLRGKIESAILRSLEGQKVKAKLIGETEDGRFNGDVKLTYRASFSGPGELALPGLGEILGESSAGGCCTEAADPFRSLRDALRPRKEERPGAPPAPPKPKGPEFKKPGAPNTFYFDGDFSLGRKMGKGEPRGFDVKNGPDGATFLVTGDENNETKVRMEAFVWVPADPKLHDRMPSLQISVVLDGEQMDLPPVEIGSGKIMESSKHTPTSGPESALLAAPIKLPQLPIPPGTHIVTIKMNGGSSRIQLHGVQETSAPAVEPAVAVDFEDNPEAPASFRVSGSVTTAAPPLLALTGKSPLPGFDVTIEEIDDERVIVRLKKGTQGQPGYAEYETVPLKKGTDYMITFTRVSPPAASTDPTGPEETEVDIEPDGTISEEPGIMTCTAETIAKLRRVLAHCWQTDVENRVRAYRGAADTADKKRRLKLRKY